MAIQQTEPIVLTDINVLCLVAAQKKSHLEQIFKLCKRANSVRVEIAHDGHELVVGLRRRRQRRVILELARHLAQAVLQGGHVFLQLLDAHLRSCSYVG